ncbi:MgtC/SapB family protein [Chitinophaga sp. Hz27]|uniref:MgtC/SapB family protein n=1 Tax=Chitinophaga sp. Hz27 TaxID=3347169 RepID=UPI0035DB88DF
MKHIIEIVGQDQVLKVLVALVMGCVIGIEREYKRKAAGMRTMALICMSSTVFTILSAELGNPGSPDRVASNILTGVGFLGAGVIFKGEFAIDGITTAASIWIASAIGMAIGMSQYMLATFALAGAMVVLLILKYLEHFVAKRNDKRIYVIQYREAELTQAVLEASIRQYNLQIRRMLLMKKDEVIEVNYEIRGPKSRMHELDDYLMKNRSIWQYQVQYNPM